MLADIFILMKKLKSIDFFNISMFFSYNYINIDLSCIKICVFLSLSVYVLEGGEKLLVYHMVGLTFISTTYGQI